jgi:hypothetical protein
LLTVQEAVAGAMKYFQSVYQAQELHDLMLEEVEKVDNEWHITVSFSRKAESNNPLAFGQQYTRVYKVAVLNAFNGDLVAIRMHKI